MRKAKSARRAWYLVWAGVALLVLTMLHAILTVAGVI